MNCSDIIKLSYLSLSSKWSYTPGEKINITELPWKIYKAETDVNGLVVTLARLWCRFGTSLAIQNWLKIELDFLLFLCKAKNDYQVITKTCVCEWVRDLFGVCVCSGYNKNVCVWVSEWFIWCVCVCVWERDREIVRWAWRMGIFLSRGQCCLIRFRRLISRSA